MRGPIGAKQSFRASVDGGPSAKRSGPVIPNLRRYDWSRRLGIMRLINIINACPLEIKGAYLEGHVTFVS